MILTKHDSLTQVKLTVLYKQLDAIYIYTLTYTQSIATGMLVSWTYIFVY